MNRLRNSFRPGPQRRGPPPVRNAMPQRGALPNRRNPMPPRRGPPPRNPMPHRNARPPPPMPQRNGPPLPRNPIRHNMQRLINSFRPGPAAGRNPAPPSHIGRGAMEPGPNRQPNRAPLCPPYCQVYLDFFSRRGYSPPPPSYPYPSTQAEIPDMGSLEITANGYTNEYADNQDA